MLELALHARRGSFVLDVECQLASEWTVIFGPSARARAHSCACWRAWTGRARMSRCGDAWPSTGHVLTDTARGTLGEARTTAHFARNTATGALSSSERAANIAFGLRSLEGRLASAALTKCWSWWARRTLSIAVRRIFLAARRSAWRWREHWRQDPRLLLLDEPFAALDGAASDALLERLQIWLRENRVQAVLATHDVSDALAIGAEVMLLREGRMVALGPAAEVLAERAATAARPAWDPARTPPTPAPSPGECQNTLRPRQRSPGPGPGLGCTGAAAIDERQRMPRADPGRAQRITLREAGLLNEPGSGDLHAALFSGPFRPENAAGRCAPQSLEKLLAHNRILEEAAGAAAVGIAFDEQHPLDWRMRRTAAATSASVGSVPGRRLDSNSRCTSA